MPAETSRSWANMHLNEDRLKKPARKSPILTPEERQVPVMKAKDGDNLTKAKGLHAHDSLWLKIRRIMLLDYYRIMWRNY